MAKIQRNSTDRGSKISANTFAKAPAQTGIDSPKLAERRDEYRFSMSGLIDFWNNLQQREPTDDLVMEPVSERMTVPEQAGIDQNGLLTVSKFIPPDNYTFVVKVANEAVRPPGDRSGGEDSTISRVPRIPGISGAYAGFPAAGLSFRAPPRASSRRLRHS